MKMVMIQDSNTPTAYEKPLRISGDQMKCSRAKELVMELLASKDDGMVSDFMVSTLEFKAVDSLLLATVECQKWLLTYGLCMLIAPSDIQQSL